MEERGGRGGGKEGKKKAGAGSWLLWQADRVLQNLTGQTSKRWKTGGSLPAGPVIGGEPYLLDGADGSSQPGRLLTSG